MPHKKHFALLAGAFTLCSSVAMAAPILPISANPSATAWLNSVFNTASGHYDPFNVTSPIGIFNVSGSVSWFSNAYIAAHGGPESPDGILSPAPVTPVSYPGDQATYSFTIVNLTNEYGIQNFSYTLGGKPVDIGLSSVGFEQPNFLGFPGSLTLGFTGTEFFVNPQGPNEPGPQEFYAHYSNEGLNAGAPIDGDGSFTVTNYAGPIMTVPEPSTLALFGSGVALLVFVKRRRRNKIKH